MSEEQNIPNKNLEDRIKNSDPIPIAIGTIGLKKEESEQQHFPEDSHAPKRQTVENMETHALHLHKAPSHGWKHYLFEF